MPQRNLKLWHVWVSALAVLLFAFLLSRDALARYAWQRYRSADVALALNRGDADLAMRIGTYCFNGAAGESTYDLKKAERAFQEALRINPNMLWGHYQLARIHFIGSDFDGALRETNEELERNPADLRSLYVRGLIYGYRAYPGDSEKAESDFKNFVQWAPGEWAGYNDLAWILSKEGKYRETEGVIQTAFQKAVDAGDNPWLWNSLGVAQLNLGEYGAAEKSFGQAKVLAEGLTVQDWSGAYPGDNPRSADEGLRAFIGAIEENLRRAKTGLVDNNL